MRALKARWPYPWLPPVFTAVAAVVLYAYTVRLPLFRDAMVMLRWMDRRSVAQIWTNARGFPYYRPLAWMFLKAFQSGPGRFHTVGLHVQSVALHALDGALVSLLAWRLWEGRGRISFALLTGLFFVSYPFSYEVIPVVGPIFQLVVMALMVGAALLYRESRVRNSRVLAAASLLVGLACPFASEYGVTLGLLLLAVEWLESGRCRFRSFSWRPLVYLGLAAAYLVIWFLVPKSRGEGLPLFSLEALGRKGVYFLQGLVFPVAPLVKSLDGGGQKSGYGVVFALAAATLVALTLFFRRVRRGREMAFSLAWFGVCLLPLWPTLDLDYVLNGPRLFYVASAGVAMLWAGLVTLLAARLRRAWIGKLAGLALALTILVGNVTFLARMQDLLAVGGGAVADVVAVAAAHDDDTPLLFVNFPSWLSPREPRFPLGYEGVSFLPGYSDIADLIYVNSGRRMNARGVISPIVWKEWPLDERFYLAPTGLVELAPEIRWAERVYVVENGPFGLRLREAGWSDVSPPAAPQAVFGDRVSLRLDGLSLRADELTVDLEWRQEGRPGRDETVFLHVYGQGGQLVAQADGYPLLGLYPTWLWEGGEIVHDVRYVPLPPGLPAGRYTVGAGLYDVETGVRLSATGADGDPLPDDVAILGTFERP